MTDFEDFLEIAPQLLEATNLKGNDRKIVYEKIKYAVSNWQEKSIYPSAKTLIAIAEGLGVYTGDIEINISLDDKRINDMLKDKEIEVQEVSLSDTDNRILTFIQDNPEGVNVRQLSLLIQATPQCARNHAKNLIKAGMITKKKLFGEIGHRFYPA